MDEASAGRLELVAERALSLFPAHSPGVEGGHHESSAGGSATLTEEDRTNLAARLVTEAYLSPAAAAAVVGELVDRATTALVKVRAGASGPALDEDEALALESVLHIRGRPALRVFGERLESLERYPGSEFWENLVTDYETGLTDAAGATGAVLVSSFTSGNPPWIQGSAWLVAPDRVVTNRHVLLPKKTAQLLVEKPPGAAAFRFRGDFRLSIDFSYDDRKPEQKLRRAVKSILYLATIEDSVDIAVLEIERYEEGKPLTFEPETAPPLKNLAVIGHPGPLTAVPRDVEAVFGRPDGRKRVSFGKRLDIEGGKGVIVHDASTVGGYSGAPVVRISSGAVSGLHYYGRPVAGNLAVTAAAVRAHECFRHFGG